MKITNNSNIEISLAVWLVHDDYDYNNESNYISATALMKPLRHIVLPRLVDPKSRTMDVEDFIPMALGNSLHNSIEMSWLKGYRRNLAKLGYPENMIDRVIVNPTEVELVDHKATFGSAIPVYLEQRAIREIDGYKIGGKFDMVAEGIVHDNKSTSAFVWVHGTRDDEHCIQGSIYRWLNPDKITEDFIRINYIFTDWQRAAAKSNPKYPQSRVQSKDIPLMSIQDTEKWIRAKLALITKYSKSKEKDVPECTPEELWQSDPQYKYYGDAANTTGRSTKNFDNLLEANTHKISKGKGVVIIVPGEAKRCNHCDAYSVCTQKDRLNA